MRSRQTVALPGSPRRSPRHQHFSELSVTYEGRSEPLRIHPPNISVKGMFIHTRVDFPEGSILKLAFRLARTGAKIVTRCEVRYCLAGVGVGVEFINLPPQGVRAIETEIGAPAAGSATVKKRGSRRLLRK
jgi:hypothetical protein